MANLKDTIILGNLTVTGITNIASKIFSKNAEFNSISVDSIYGKSGTGIIIDGGADIQFGASGDVVPMDDDAISLGSSTKRWSNSYFTGLSMYGPISFDDRRNQAGLSHNYISAGGGHNKTSGLYGLKIVALDQDNAQMGLGVDLTGNSYELTMATSRANDTTASTIAFATHTANSTDYKTLATLSASGAANPTATFTVNGSISGTLTNSSLPLRIQNYSTSGHADANSAVEQGWHYMTTTGTNRPPFKQSSNKDYRIMTTAYSSSWLQQIATDFRGNDMFIRRCENGTWKPWTPIVRFQDCTSAHAMQTITDNAIVRWDTSGTAMVQNSGVTIDDNGNVATTGYVKSNRLTFDKAIAICGNGYTSALTYSAPSSSSSHTITMFSANSSLPEASWSSNSSAVNVNYYSTYTHYGPTGTYTINLTSFTVTLGKVSATSASSPTLSLRLTSGSSSTVVATFSSKVSLTNNGQYSQSVTFSGSTINNVTLTYGTSYHLQYFLSNGTSSGITSAKGRGTITCTASTLTSEHATITIGAESAYRGSTVIGVRSPGSSPVAIGAMGVQIATISSTTSTGWTVASDRRDKTDIQPIEKGLQFINQLEPVTFVDNHRSKYIDENNQYWKNSHECGVYKGDRRRAGLIAQDVYQVLKATYNTDNYASIVDYNKYDPAKINEEEMDRYSMTYTQLIPFLIKAIQEQQELIEQQQQQINRLQNIVGDK